MKKNNKIYSNGGRVLNITASSENLIEARDKSLTNIKKINWSDGFFRRDIGWRVINNINNYENYIWRSKRIYALYNLKIKLPDLLRIW